MKSFIRLNFYFTFQFFESFSKKDVAGVNQNLNVLSIYLFLLLLIFIHFSLEIILQKIAFLKCLVSIK